MRLFTVGPVEMFDEVKAVRADNNSVPYFRTQEFSDLMLDTDELLQKFAHAPRNAKTIYLTASGTAAMEATVQNCFSSSDRLLIINGGTFGQRFVDICQIHNIPHDVIRLEYGEILSKSHFDKVCDNEYKALLVNIDETSTGQLYDIKIISHFCQSKNMYLIVDAISSFLCDSFDMEEYGIDAMIASSQKGACISPGLSMVILSERLINECIMTNDIHSLYFNYKSYMDDFQRGQTPFTPAVGICIELNTALHMIEKKGLENHLQHIADVAEDFRKKVKALPVEIPEFPLSNAITPIIFKRPIAYKVFEILKSEYDIYVNPTGGVMHDVSLRIAHIGKTNKKDNSILIECMKKSIAKVK